MVAIPALILPILLATALVWISSALIWTTLPWHKKDFSKLPDEDAAVAALRPQNLEPGQYNLPHAEWSDMKDPAMQQRFAEGPVGFLTVLPRGMPAMGKAMILSVVFYLVVSFAIAYIASRTLTAEADYMAVFRVTGTVAWMTYGAAVIPDAIWFGRPWSSIFKGLGDAFIYALLTAGAFGGLWPAAG